MIFCMANEKVKVSFITSYTLFIKHGQWWTGKIIEVGEENRGEKLLSFKIEMCYPDYTFQF